MTRLGAIAAAAGSASKPGSRVLWRALAASLLALSLGGCATRVLYHQLDWITVWYIERYVDLDRPQESLLREVVAGVITWHRTTQLPRYAEIARSLRADADGTITVDMLNARYLEIDALFDAFRVHIVPGSARVFRTLTEAQITEIAGNLEEENDDLQKEYSGDTPEDRRRKQERVITKNLRRMLGPLSPAQEAVVHSGVASLHDVAHQWLERRRAWQTAFLGLLERDRQSPEFEPQLLALVLDPNRFDSPGYREQVDDNRRIVVAMIAEVLGTRSPAQKKQLQERLDDFARDFELLANEKKQEGHP